MNPATLQVEFSAQLESIPKARHQLARWLENRRVPSEITEEIALVVTELVTNAIEASPDSDARIEIELYVENDEQVVLKVRDEGVGFSETVTSVSLPAFTESRGRGLPIVTALMDGFIVRRRRGCTEVEVTRQLPHPKGSLVY